MTTDKIRLEILGNRFQAVVDEMAQVVSRTAHTVFVKETQDYGSVLVSRRGEVFAAPRRYGVLMMIGMPMDGAIEAVGKDVVEGDIFISNDPVSTRGMATHLSDVYLWKPIFVDGELLCWAWTFIHVSDIGGRVPGSIAPSSHEVYQEGLRITPQKLYRAGVLNKPLLDMIRANCRTPDQNWGDMKACLAGLATAENRVRDLAAQYGFGTIDRTIDQVLDYAETQARRVIDHVPDGTYHYADYLEADMVGLGLVRIKVAMTIKGGEMLLDFTGTAPQVRAALNIPTYSRDGHWMLITGLVNWICTQEPNIAYNAGLVRPMKVHIPRGTILNPEPGAAYGARYATSHKVCDVTVGALAQAVPDELPATDSGQGSILLVSVPDFRTGGDKVSVIQPIVGGSGGRPMADGVDGTMVILNFLKNIPTEIFENEMPEILIHHYGLRDDSGGPGKYRGGTGIEIEFETSSPYTSITSRCMERYIFGPPGLSGGDAGATGYTWFMAKGEAGRDIGKIDVLTMEPGDRLKIGTQGGGGYGDPLERPAERVADDVANGFVSAATATQAYGVAFDGSGAVDPSATAARRAEMRGVRGWSRPPLHGFDAARLAHMARWTDELEDALAAAVAGLPIQLMQFLHGRLKAEVAARLDRGETVGAGDVAAIVAAQRAALDGTQPLAAE
jgi:N-methylhydantoinase B